MKTEVAAISQVTAWDSETLSSFDKSRKDILVIDRPPIPGLPSAMRAARVLNQRARVMASEVGPFVAEAVTYLHIDCPALIDDITELTRSFLAQFKLSTASLRIEVVTVASCPKFHCDNLLIRLVTTYHGPATEFIHVDRPDRIEQVRAGALVFLKGRAHPSHADEVHHRSPVVPYGEKRLCVVLDV